MCAAILRGVWTSEQASSGLGKRISKGPEDWRPEQGAGLELQLCGMTSRGQLSPPFPSLSSIHPCLLQWSLSS